MMQLMRFKILIVSLVAAMLFAFLLTSCEPQVTTPRGESNGETTTLASQTMIPSPNPVLNYHLELVSQGIKYQLIEHWVYSVENGTSADGKHFDKLAVEMDPTLKVDLEAAKVIPYADDFTFLRVSPSGSEKQENLSINIFDENLEIIQRNVDKPVIPSESGLYYVAVLVSWGDKDNSSGYQYIFKTRRQ